MKPWLRWFGILLATVVVLVAVGIAVLYLLSGRRLDRTWDIRAATIQVHADSGTLHRGEHVARTRGCTDCHGEELAGATFIDSWLFGRFSGPNLTPDGIGADYSTEDWVRAIRHGVGPSGRSLAFMPSHEYTGLGREDLGALVTFLSHLPPVENDVAPNRVGMIARFLLLRGELPLLPAELIDHTSPIPTAPGPGATVEYGRYLAASCIGCHGPGLAGGPVPGAPPEWPLAANLTPDPSGLEGWTLEDFSRVLRTGRAPDDRALDPAYMPWTTTANMTPEEIEALWVYLLSLQPLPTGETP